MSDNIVDRLTAQLRQMAADFEIRPEERIIEGAMAKRLAVSRTPLREALNRLVSEGYMTFTAGQGFFCRALTPEQILDLYEARAAVECEGVRLALQRAEASDIAALVAELDATEPLYEGTSDRLTRLEMDEAFHLSLVRLSGNAELERMLTNINGRIRYVRMIGLNMSQEGASPNRMSEHRAILEALSEGDADRALATLRAHIEMRKEDATEAVRHAFSQIYVRAG
ncbi:GntR family transcriptional regulator [Gymnodinialimonas hymeniacidonis]|uniref:GntR family transcriptional regulator n=1 Tax=Gymnodinialimonas hymeniacidonis TaxID=3126508 RepID=UPI0034C63F2E